LTDVKEPAAVAELPEAAVRCLIDSIYDGMQGTMYIPMRVDARLDVIKKRALELKGCLDLITEGKQMPAAL
jgi:hypothetical protein